MGDRGDYCQHQTLSAPDLSLSCNHRCCPWRAAQRTFRKGTPIIWQQPAWPPPVIEALPEQTYVVEGVAARCRGTQERHWLAAALAALANHVQAGTLTEPPSRARTRPNVGDVPVLVAGARPAGHPRPAG